MSTADTTGTSNPLLVAALAYAARGWPVLPLHTPTGALRQDGKPACSCRRDDCSSQGKHPRITAGLKGATVDPATITGWWAMWPEANVGVRTGPLTLPEGATPCYLTVLDVDPRHGGDEALEALTDARGTLPDTALCLTGGGGRHFFFEGATPCKTTSGALGPGLDTRGGGGSHGAGYVVAAPSVHASGRPYGWELSSDPTDPDAPCTLAAPPAWLIAGASGVTGVTVPTAAPSGDGEPILDGDAGGPGRKKSLLSQARRMRTGGATEGEILAALTAMNARCVPPLSDQDVARMAKQGAKKPPGRSPEWEAAHSAPAGAAPTPAVRKPRRPIPRGIDADWERELIAAPRGGWLGIEANALLILQKVPEWDGVLEYDERRGHVRLVRPPPFEETYAGRGAIPRELSDADLTRIAVWFQRSPWALALGPEKLKPAVVLAAGARSVEPVKAYLEGLTWDSTPRLDRWLETYCGAVSSTARAAVGMTLEARARHLAYIRAVGAKWLVAAVARTLEPGCQVDTVLCLEGDQGIGKSSVARVLGGDFFSDEVGNIADSKNTGELLQGPWVVELAELDGLSRAERTRAKAWISKCTDTYRAPWDRLAEGRPRRCVFIATTNEDDYLSDETGARRWWPVRCTRIDLEGLKRDRDQLWAEAVVRYRTEHCWHITPAEADVLAAAKAQQEARRTRDVWEPAVLRYCAGREWVTVQEILTTVIQMEVAKQGRREQMRVGAILIGAKWVHAQRREGTARVWVYYRPDDPPSKSGETTSEGVTLDGCQPESTGFTPPETFPEGRLSQPSQPRSEGVCDTFSAVEQPLSQPSQPAQPPGQSSLAVFGACTTGTPPSAPSSTICKTNTLLEDSPVGYDGYDGCDNAVKHSVSVSQTPLLGGYAGCDSRWGDRFPEVPPELDLLDVGAGDA